MRKVEKHSLFHFMHPTWAVSEAFNRKVGQAPFEIVRRLPLSDLSVFQSWEAEGISTALGTLRPACTPCLGLFGDIGTHGPMHKISFAAGKSKVGRGFRWELWGGGK